VDDDQVADDLARRIDDVTRQLAELDGLLGTGEELDRLLQVTAEQVATGVPGADMVSVSVLAGESWRTVAATSDRVVSIDQDQYAAGDGPCLEAARTREVTRTGVAEAEERWPLFARSAEAAGVRSYLAFPLVIGEEFAGSLNLYSEQPHGFADFDVALLRLHVTVACAAIAGDRRSADARRVARQLTEALESRAVIDQAVGMLMAWTGSSAEQAFAELARQSQNTNVKLREIAVRLVTTRRPPRG
jgi:GAF domain-containing protein